MHERNRLNQDFQDWMSLCSENCPHRITEIFSETSCNRTKLLKMARFWAGQGVKFKPIPIETHYPTHASVHRGATYISAVLRQHPPDVG